MHTVRVPGSREGRLFRSIVERMTTARERDDVACRQRDQSGVGPGKYLLDIAGTKFAQFKFQTRLSAQWFARELILQHLRGLVVSFELRVSLSDQFLRLCGARVSAKDSNTDQNPNCFLHVRNSLVLF